MALFTKTISDLIKAHYPLFDPTLEIYDYEGLQRAIIDRFYSREIAYETPDLFRIKLNAALRLRKDSYNKMMYSQMIAIDPFVTEYMVIDAHERHADKTNNSKNYIQGTASNSTQVQNTDTNFGETYKAGQTTQHNKENVGTEVNGKLYSEAQNQQTGINENDTRSLTKNETIDTNEGIVRDLTRNEVTDETENKIRDLTRKEVTNEEMNKQTDKQVDTNTATTHNHNQTGRNWTENGNSRDHSLDVNSNTPQGMLFNTPQAYYGTGKEDTHGTINSDGSVSDFAEANEYTGANVGDSDYPWYNYASNANNHTHHDSYNKAGTETFTQSDDDNQTKGETTSETIAQTTDTTKNITEHETTDTTTHIAKDTTEHESTDRTLHTTDSTTERETNDKTTNTVDAKAVNSNEHSKTDNTANENYKEEGVNHYAKDNTQSTGYTGNTATKVDESYHERGDEKTHGHVDNNSVRKGRSGKSPAQLLREYRETLTFNATMWILGELEPLFLQLY